MDSQKRTTPKASTNKMAFDQKAKENQLKNKKSIDIIRKQRVKKIITSKKTKQNQEINLENQQKEANNSSNSDQEVAIPDNEEELDNNDQFLFESNSEWHEFVEEVQEEQKIPQSSQQQLDQNFQQKIKLDLTKLHQQPQQPQRQNHFEEKKKITIQVEKGKAKAEIEEEFMRELLHLETQAVESQKVGNFQKDRYKTIKMMDQIIEERKSENDNESDYGSISRASSIDRETSLGIPGFNNRLSNNQDDFLKKQYDKQITTSLTPLYIRQDLVKQNIVQHNLFKKSFKLPSHNQETLEQWQDAIKLSEIEQAQPIIDLPKTQIPPKTDIETKMEQERNKFKRSTIEIEQVNLQEIKQGGQQLYSQFKMNQRDKIYAVYRINSDVQVNKMNKLLQDVVLYLISGNFKIHSNMISDYEISGTQLVFQQMIEKAQRCHEAYYGLGKNYFHLRQYERAKDAINKAIKFKKDNTYIVWSGIIYLYLGVEYAKKSQSPEFKDNLKIMQLRDRYINDAVKFLGRCRKRKEEGVCANFALLFLCFVCKEYKIQFTKLKDPENYANKIKEFEDYYGYIAWALIYLHHKKEKYDLGIDVLTELMDMHPQRPEAYITLWNVYFKNKKDYTQALNVAEKLFICATDYTSFQEKLLITQIYAKSLYENQEYVKAFTLLQLEYSKAPHYACNLYLYGKLAVLSKMTEFYGSAIGALEECLRQCLPFRHPNTKYYMGLAYEVLKRKTKAFMNYQDYLNTSQQPLNRIKKQQIHQFNTKLDIETIKLQQFVRQFILLYSFGQLQNELIYNKDQQSSIINGVKQNTWFTIYQKIVDFDKFEADLFKCLYTSRIFNDTTTADQEFQHLLKSFPENVEGILEYLKFLKKLGNIKAASALSSILLSKLENDQVPTTLWVNSNLHIAKLNYYSNRIEDALVLLLRLRQVLPPIDTQQVSDYKMPFKIDKYHDNPLYDKFQNKFQEDLYVIDEDEEHEFSRSIQHISDFRSRSKNVMVSKEIMITDNNYEFGFDDDPKELRQSVIEEEDENMQECKLLTKIPNYSDDMNYMNKTGSNQRMKEDDVQTQERRDTMLKFKYNSENTEQQFLGRKMLTERMQKESQDYGSIKNQTSVRSPNPMKSMSRQKSNYELKKSQSSIMYFAQGPFDNESNQNSNPQRMNSSRSSMPKIAFLNLLQQKSFSAPHQIEEDQANSDSLVDQCPIKDTGFSVFSDPKFLYVIGKICARSQLYSDLAIQSFHDYLMIITYYKNYMSQDDYLRIKCKTYIWIASVFWKVEEYEDCEKVLMDIYTQCMEFGGRYFEEMENLFCQVNKAKGIFKPQNLVRNHFYPENYKEQRFF